MSSGGSDTPPTQTTTFQLTPEQREILGYALPSVRSFAAAPLTRTEGPRVAGFDPSQTAGQEMALGAAGTQQQLAEGGAGTTGYWLRPGALDVNQDPTIRSAIEASIRPITQQFTEQILPELRSGSIASGPYGGSRLGVSQALGAERTARAVGDTASKVALGARDQAIQAQLRALGFLPQTMQAQVAPATTTSAVGDVRQAMTQAQLNEAIAAGDFAKYAELLKAQELIKLLGGVPGGTTTSTGSVAPGPSPLMKGLGGAATGASLGSAFGPWGAVGGGVIGGALPFLFD